MGDMCCIRPDGYPPHWASRGDTSINEHERSVAGEYCWSFAPELAAAGDARLRLTTVLDGWGLSPQWREDALMVMSELVTNATEYAQGPFALRVSFTSSTVLIEVSDGSPAAPQLQPFDIRAPSGRGLQFVDALAHTWGWRRVGDGKSVWAEMAAIDLHEQPAGQLADHGELISDTDQVEHAEQPGRAPRDPDLTVNANDQTSELDLEHVTLEGVNVNVGVLAFSAKPTIHRRLISIR